MSAPHQFRCRILSALAALAGLLLALLGPYAVPAAAGPSEREVLRAVHTDALHVTYDGGRLGLLTRIGTGRDPGRRPGDGGVQPG